MEHTSPTQRQGKLQTIPIARIHGTLSRSNDFDLHFHPHYGHGAASFTNGRHYVARPPESAAYAQHPSDNYPRHRRF